MPRRSTIASKHANRSRRGVNQRPNMPNLAPRGLRRPSPPQAEPPAELRPESVAVLLVYGAEITVSRGGRPGIRVTAGYHDGSVLLEAVQFDNCHTAVKAICEAAQACLDAGLVVQFAPHRMSNYPARVVHRRAA